MHRISNTSLVLAVVIFALSLDNANADSRKKNNCTKCKNAAKNIKKKLRKLRKNAQAEENFLKHGCQGIVTKNGIEDVSANELCDSLYNSLKQGNRLIEVCKISGYCTTKISKATNIKTANDDAPRYVPDPKKPANILMIALDDMNDWVGFLGKGPPVFNQKMGLSNRTTVTPNMDKLAYSAGATIFEHAYAPSSVCLPSRAATLTGVRPTTSGIYGTDIDWWDVVGGGAGSNRNPNIFEYFQNEGYETIGTGKVCICAPCSGDDNIFQFTFTLTSFFWLRALLLFTPDFSLERWTGVRNLDSI